MSTLLARLVSTLEEARSCVQDSCAAELDFRIGELLTEYNNLPVETDLRQLLTDMRPVLDRVVTDQLSAGGDLSPEMDLRERLEAYLKDT